MLSIIAAVSSNGVIGIENRLPWQLSDDLKRFKSITTGHNVIMGRKTYESIGKPLPNRLNIVITKNLSYKPSDPIIVVNSIDQAIRKSCATKETFLIGGENIWRQSIGFVDKIYLTRVNKEFEGDAFFPTLDDKEWELEQYQGVFQDSKSGLPFYYETYKKRW